ncbi:MAG TPA: pyrrolo-quinoline quinone [Verrucomicrobiae bacterium]|nr:pyrrolo-quinoline quinone [Verrucomicrobiae bacterium]
MGKRAGVVGLAAAATVATVFLTAALQKKLVSGNRSAGGDDPPVFRWHKAARTRGGDPSAPRDAKVLTYHNDEARTGQNLEEKILTPRDVKSGDFGKVGFLATDGLVDAEPLYVSNLAIGGRVRNVVFAATEHDSVYAFDADTLAPIWHVSLLGPDETPSDDRSCPQVSPEIGITATPVIELNGDTGRMYLVAMSKDKNGNYFQRLHAIDIASGNEISGSPVTIEATYPNLKGKTTFDPKEYKERTALLLLNGVVYTTWASHCDLGDYTGWVIGYSAASLKQVNVLDVTPNGSDGAIWMSGAGPAADADGNIYLLDANGTFDRNLNSSGFPIHGDFGNAFLKLTPRGANLTVADYFNMHNTGGESLRDEDLGSGGALVLPDLKDASGKTRQLAVGAGKDTRIYVVNRNAMGKFNPRTDSGIYQEIDHALSGAVFSMPAYFNSTVYYGAVDDSLKAFPIIEAKLGAEATSKTAARFAYPGTTPSISANAGADAIVWAVEARGSDAGVLHAYDAGDLGHELYNSSQAGGRDAFSDNKFVTPMIANGRVFVGTLTGVMVFGLLP